MSTYSVNIGDKTFRVDLLRRGANSLTFGIGAQTYEVDIQTCIEHTQAVSSVPTQSAPRAASAARKGAAQPGQILAPMPGIVTKVLVNVGDQVSAGQALLTIEAMKMENSISSPCAGTVKKISAQAGQEVLGQQELILLA